MSSQAFESLFSFEREKEKVEEKDKDKDKIRLQLITVTDEFFDVTSADFVDAVDSTIPSRTFVFDHGRL